MRMRIDELAAEAGTTSRTIRAYQAKGLLPPPELEGRTGYYGEEHLRRLEIIDELQARGFSLAAIRSTLDAWAHGGDLSHLIGFQHVVTAPWVDEEPRTYTIEELRRIFPGSAERPELTERAVDQGLLRDLGEGRYEAPSPMLIEAGAELVRAGVPLDDVLELVTVVREDVRDIADRMVALVWEHVIAPVARPDADLDRVAEAVDAVERLRPVAMEVVRPFLGQALAEARDRAIAQLGADLEPDEPHSAG